jgi:hypothetical protein
MGQGLTKQGPRRMENPFIPPAVSQGQMGVFGPTSQFSSHYAIPVGLGVDFLPKHGFDVGAEFMFPALGRGSAVAGKATDSRTLMLYAVWRNP